MINTYRVRERFPARLSEEGFPTEKTSIRKELAYLIEGSLASVVEVLEVLFCFFELVDEDDLFFLFFDRSAIVGRTKKTILCVGAVGRHMLV